MKTPSFSEFFSSCRRLCRVRLGGGEREGIRGSDAELTLRVHHQITLSQPGMFMQCSGMFMQCSAQEECSTGDSQAKSASNALMCRIERAKGSDGEAELSPTIKPKISPIDRVNSVNKAL